MSNTQKLAEIRQSGSRMVGYVFDLAMMSLLFGRVGRLIERLVNVAEKPTNHVSDVEQRALQMMEDRNALMQILAKRPDYLLPGTYDDLIG